MGRDRRRRRQEVHDDVDALDRASDVVAVQKVADDGVGHGGGVERETATEAVENDHLVPGADEPIDDVRADKAVAADNEDPSHASLA